MSAVVNKKCAILSSSFTKQLAIANINFTNDFLEEVKHHWGLFSVPKILQEKLHSIAINNVDEKSKLDGSSFEKTIKLTKMHCIS
jgi:hypothetical protein